jgi:uncharacterized protein with PIN domain
MPKCPKCKAELVGGVEAIARGLVDERNFPIRGYSVKEADHVWVCPGCNTTFAWNDSKLK